MKKLATDFPDNHLFFEVVYERKRPKDSEYREARFVKLLYHGINPEGAFVEAKREFNLRDSEWRLVDWHRLKPSELKEWTQ